MRMLLKANLDTEKTNEVIRGGRMPQLMQEIMETFKPEAAYFAPDDGVRTMFLFFDMQEPSQMPPLTERFFQEFGARVDYRPVMNLEDVQKGLSQLKVS